MWVGLATRLEVAVSARDPNHWPTLRRQLLDPLLPAEGTPRSEAIAMDMMEALLDARMHRSVPLPDVLVASLAAANRLTVLHHDRDFDRIHRVYSGPRRRAADPLARNVRATPWASSVVQALAASR